MPTPSAPLFIQKERKAAIYSFNKNKALSLDNINQVIIRNLYENYPTLLLDLYNYLLRLNYFPKDWKIDELVNFLKLGESPDRRDLTDRSY